MGSVLDIHLRQVRCVQRIITREFIFLLKQHGCHEGNGEEGERFIKSLQNKIDQRQILQWSDNVHLILANISLYFYCNY